MTTEPGTPGIEPHHGFTNAVVRSFLNSNLSLILVLLAAGLGISALLVSPREEDPQIVVPIADVYVNFPGHSAEEVEQLVTTPLEKLLYEIDGVEYVYSMSHEGNAVITVRFYVGEDRERSLVKLYKRIDENVDLVPAGVTGWVIKPVEIDDVPIVTLTLTSAVSDGYTLRRVGEEVVQRLSTVRNLSRAYVIGGEPRVCHVYLDPARMQAHHVSPLEIQRAINVSNVDETAGEFVRQDQAIRVEAGTAFANAEELGSLVVGVSGENPVLLKEVATVEDGASEVTSYVRHGWGPARGFEHRDDFTGTLVDADHPGGDGPQGGTPAVTLAFAKKKGTNAVTVARDILAAAKGLKETVIPSDIDLVITRNYGLTADDKVNELVEALGVAIFIVIALLTLGMGWREAVIVALAVPVVFGLTLTVNLLFGFSINRVTLFALILSLGLLVDDPIVDVENISRHFALRGRATRQIVLEAVAEIRPPLITATLAVIVSFLPMFFITGMMGPYMRPMALNVPVAMVMSMFVAFTITPWVSYHVLRRKYDGAAPDDDGTHVDDLAAVKQSALYRLFYPLMAPLLHSRRKAWTFLAVMGALTLAATALAATRHVPLKILPFDNKNELLLVLDLDEGTTLERTDACAREMEAYLRTVREVTDYTSYVGLASPMDFNGMVRHYYLRRGQNVAEIRMNLVGKKSRKYQSHAIGLRLRGDLDRIAQRYGAIVKIVEVPPGPPVIDSVVAEVRGQPGQSYEELMDAARVVRARCAVEPGVVDLDDSIEAAQSKLVFVTDKEKAALSGVSVSDVVETLKGALEGAAAGTLHVPTERQPLRIELRLPESIRSSASDLAQIYVKGDGGVLVPLAEIGHWEHHRVDQTIYHKNLKRVVYVFAETAGRPPADVVVDIQADQSASPLSAVQNAAAVGNGWIGKNAPRPIAGRTFFRNGSDVAWHVPRGIDVSFSGEGEWNITLDVFRDLGLAFAAALVGIYILLVGQTGSFGIPVIVMLAIPLNVLGIMPGFWLLNLFAANTVGGYADPVFFTATGMIGMIALAGIVTRDAIILVDFIHLSQARGRSLFDAIMESRVVRLRPILLTAGTAMLSAAPITIDPVFSGLAWSLIFGLFASTVFTLFVIPIAYWLIYEHKPRPEAPAA